MGWWRQLWSRRAVNKSGPAPDFVTGLLTERLLARLPLFRLQPQQIVCFCAAKTELLLSLQQQYPRAHILVKDIADIATLTENSADLCLLVAPLQQPFAHPDTLAALTAGLKTQGLLLFITLGDQTLSGLSLLSTKLEDMHTLGDQLLAEGLTDPVMDAETVPLHYRRATTFSQDWSCYSAQEALAAMLAAWPAELETQLELVYGHAWKMPLNAATSNEQKIAISNIKRSHGPS